MGDPMYPDDVSGKDICYMEGCIGNGACPRCGKVNRKLLGYNGAVAKWAKEWGVSKSEARKRMRQSAKEADCD